MQKLVAFFSASGITKDIAHTIANIADAELFEILPQTPYSRADLDWNNEHSRSTLECKDKHCRVPIATHIDISSFDVIFLGFPVWWYKAPPIIDTFLESNDFSGKIIVPFCTSGGSELEPCVRGLRTLAPKAIFKNGRKFDFGANRANVRKWLESLALQ